jgi:hypothetical protein
MGAATSLGGATHGRRSTRRRRRVTRNAAGAVLAMVVCVMSAAPPEAAAQGELRRCSSPAGLGNYELFAQRRTTSCGFARNVARRLDRRDRTRGLGPGERFRLSNVYSPATRRRHRVRCGSVRFGRELQVACSTVRGADMMFEIRLTRTRLCRNTFGGDLIHARIVSCRRARQVVRSWGRRYRRDGRASRRVWEYSCRGRNDAVEGLVVRCARVRGRATITFFANVPR